MNDSTRAYLRGRFGDHYRRVEVPPPPAANEREWGYIPFSRGETRMIRHKSLLDLGEFGDEAGLAAFLARERPRHVYFSAARYDTPGADSMSAKGWRAADLVFDLDADHLPTVDPDAASYAEMLRACKQALGRLLDLLTEDFGFADPTVVFSGGRGYHVHVRERAVAELDRRQRREIVDYVLGADVDLDTLVETEPVGGLGRKTPADKRTLRTDGGWSRRVHRRIVSFVDDLLDLPEKAALERLQSFDGIGEGRATAALNAARSNYEEIAAGNIDVHPAFYAVAEAVADRAVAAQSAPIDEPVTTDINRLIRLPGSLHGGTGLAVRRIDRNELADFDPLVDAVPETFRGNDIVVDVTDPGPVDLDGDSFTVQAGEQTVPEPVGVFLMARGRAEKGPEGR